MNPVCHPCKTTMKCKKNGVSVAHEDNPNYVIWGDMFACGHCGAEVVSSTGEYHRSEHPAQILLTGNS